MRVIEVDEVSAIGRFMRFILLSAVCALIAGSSCECSDWYPDEFYVSPKGNDFWTGTLAEPNKGCTDGPFATIERAALAARELKRYVKRNGPMTKPVTIVLREGTYWLNRPFALGAGDSGTQSAPITYVASDGEEVTISGGWLIEDFEPVEVNGHKMVVANVPAVKDGKWKFSQFFVNGVRRPRTRLPKEGCYRIVDFAGVPLGPNVWPGTDKFRFNEGEIKAWRNLADVDVVGLSYWFEMRLPVKAVDEAGRTIELAKKSKYRLTDDWSKRPGRYFIENVFEALDTPGQWYLDRPAGKLYYYPKAGEDVSRVQFVAPWLDQIVRVVGDDKHPIEYVTFRNLRFAHTEYLWPPDGGESEQAAFQVPGAIFFENAKNCALDQCEISRIGTYAVEFGRGCRDNRIEECRMADLGAGGVKINTGSENTTVADNDIGDGGKIFMSAAGVWIADSPYNKVLHNNIHDFDYTGVSLGWTWGYAETQARDNIIEQNHIHNIGRGVLSDMGGIYTLGTQPGTVLRNNLIHDVSSYGYGGWGIYTDEGSSHILVENNVVYNTRSGGFHQNAGKENILRNNVFAFGKDQQIQRYRDEDHLSFTFEHNIIYYEQGVLLGSKFANDHYEMDYNIYWDASGRPIDFAGASFDAWKKRGHDEHSLIADPKFVDPKKRDFRLQPDSPAPAMGIKQIDVSRVGPRGKIGPR